MDTMRKVRIHDNRVYVERVPNYFVDVCAADWYESFTEHEKAYMIEKALKHGHEKEWHEILNRPTGNR